MPCELANEIDPCFATYACFCDNGYFRLAENMPPVPEDVEIDEETQAKLDEANSAVEDSKAEAEAEAEAEQ